MIGGVAKSFVPETNWFSGFLTLAACPAVSTCLDFYRGCLFKESVLWISPNHVN
jgi:hypothetical protein